MLRKRYYIMLVMRDADGNLRKLPIPLHYLYVFLAGALIGMFTLTGLAGSYTRMAAKAERFNDLRLQQKALKNRYAQLEQVAQEKEMQVASLGSLASEVSSLYGLKADSLLASEGQFTEEQFVASIDQFHALKTSAFSGAATLAIGFDLGPNATTADWMRLASAPNIWPVEGRVTGSFGERIDPFNGEGAFHSGIDISGNYGQKIYAPASGTVVFVGTQAGYGKMIVLDHGHGITTRFGHMSGFVAVAGQRLERGDVVGYVGSSGRSTGAHLHYEVRIHNTPVNPYKYLRTTLAQTGSFNASGM
jgi:murein DD-endopeptidase MepM/ murein hydrolase activator NlpD